MTQYDNATVGSGSVTDEVKFSYSDWGELRKYEQDNNSAVGAIGSVDDYEVAYAFEKAATGWRTVRRSTLTLPSGNVIDYKYRSVQNRHDDEISRVTHLNDGLEVVAFYEYNGLSQVVGTDYVAIDVMQNYFESTPGEYPTLDRFDRIVEDIWLKDLSTDVALYDVDLTYDRNSNITVLDEHVHDGFDVEYTYDDLNRLTKASEGTWNGSSITSKTREQEWTLNQTGNWEFDKLDLNGDGDYVDTDEHNDDRTYNAVNELTGRDTDDNGTDDHTLSFDAAGNLTDDDEDYEYEYDAFYRLRKINDQSQALILENTYNGLGHRISAHFDSDEDGDVDGSDDWEHYAYDERWREVAMFLNSDTAPTTEHLNHAAGRRGNGRASYIDRVAYRDRDTSGSGLDERLFYLQNRHHDVVCLIRDNASEEQVEMVRYSSYGVPFMLPAGDVDSDGDCDGASEIQGLGSYDVRGDLDLDGDVDSSDESLAVVLMAGREASSAVDSRRVVEGLPVTVPLIRLARSRANSIRLGAWLQRDSLGYVDGPNMVLFLRNSPISHLDPFGLAAQQPDFVAGEPGEHSHDVAGGGGQVGVENPPGGQNGDAFFRVTFGTEGEQPPSSGCVQPACNDCLFSMTVSLNIEPTSGTTDPDELEEFNDSWHGEGFSESGQATKDIDWGSGSADDGDSEPEPGTTDGWGRSYAKKDPGNPNEDGPNGLYSTSEAYYTINRSVPCGGTEIVFLAAYTKNPRQSVWVFFTLTCADCPSAGIYGWGQ